MSRHYLLDGYNIIKQIPSLADKSLEDGRLGLIRWLNVQRPQGSVNNKVTLVFDGNPNHFGLHDGGDVLVVFSQHGSADDHIKMMVEDSTDKKNLVVVSNDKDVYLYARAQGAQVLKVAQFASDLLTGNARASKGKQASQVPSKKYVSLANQAIINKELSKLWLNEQ